MKQYRLVAWPDLDASHERMAYRRVLSELSQRSATLADLSARSGLARHDVADFVTTLMARGCVVERDAVRPRAFFTTWRPVVWLRRLRSPVAQNTR
jgi:hypothetical protein